MSTQAKQTPEVWAAKHSELINKRDSLARQIKELRAVKMPNFAEINEDHLDGWAK